MQLNRYISTLKDKQVYSATLAVFRLLFGLMIFGSIIRFWAKGWIAELYITPTFYFHYFGFEWIKPLGEYTYGLFFVCGASALFFALGLFYRLSSIILFLSFTYIELMDKTNYLNHYYFVSLALFLMIWLPAQANLSIDNIRKPQTAKRFLPVWTTGSIRLLLAIVYIYAGMAKLNSDWLVEAMPLRIWLPAKNDMPVIGTLFNKVWIAYLFSWFGAFYDLTVPFFLMNRKTRPFAYFTVIVFHVLTAILFPIGMFPYVMILATLIFFDSGDIDRLVNKVKRFAGAIPVSSGESRFSFTPLHKKMVLGLFTAFFVLQLLMPFRYLLMSDELFWTEEGYRFSWRVMLMEKMGYAQFVIKDGNTGKTVVVNNEDFLTKNQEKMMATQPDLILQYAKLLHDTYKGKGMIKPEVYGTVYVSLNGRRSRLFIDPTIDLAAEQDSYNHKQWILAFNDKIHGL